MGISVNKMQEAIKEMKSREADYKDKKKISSEAFDKYNEQRLVVLAMFEEEGITKFHVPELGTAYTSTKWSVTTPKTIEDKQALFKYLQEHGGKDFLLEKQSINSATLNAWFNQEFQTALDEGRELKVPGLEDPVAQQSVKFRKG